MATIAILGTCDTKLEELLFLQSQIHQHGHDLRTLLIDVGRKDCPHEAIHVRPSGLLKQHGESQNASQLPRGDFVKVMGGCAAALMKQLLRDGAIHGAIAAGGSCGSSLVSESFRDVLPIGFPKLIVSTVASGDTSYLVGQSDTTLMYSVVDIGGLNEVLKDILCNAAAAISAMALSYAKRRESPPRPGGGDAKKRRVAITMFGVTTPGVDAIRAHLESSYPVETYVFHATGHGGKSMERFIDEGRIDGVIDLTTTEVCDMVSGGIMACSPERFDAAVRAGIPNIVSLGATDMSNFGPRSTVPEKYRDRKLFEHNPMVTLMRTSEDESRQVAEFIAKKLRTSRDASKVQLWIPGGGVSAIATPGGPFADPSSDAVLFGTVKDKLSGSGIKVMEDERHVNDKGFARDIAEELASLMGLR